MGKNYLIDSNIIIYFLAQNFDSKTNFCLSNIFDEELNISIVTEMEILGYEKVTKQAEEFIGLARIYELDRKTVRETIHLRKKFKIGLADAIIAATAISHNFVLITKNTKDFKKINHLKILDPIELPR